MKRGARWWYFIAPLVCLAVFWRMPFIWFHTDDFAWLGLPLKVHDLHSLLSVLFHPEAQGTVRVLGDRIPFLVLTSLFGTWAAPFRVLTLVTWFAALTLANLIGVRLTGSRWAGLAASILWTCSYAVVQPLVWASDYDQVLCSCLLLAALYGRMRWLDSREVRWRVLEWIAYLLGFGALEITVMYPAAALLYTWCVARRKDTSAFALLIPAAVFSAIHFLFIPKTTSDIYRIVVDRRLPVTLLRYLKVALGPAGFDVAKVFPQTLAIMLGAALAAFTAVRIKHRDWAALFCLSWFVLFLVPVLPLPNHFSVYYLTLPVLGLCWLGGWAMTAAWRSGIAARAGALILCALFLADSIPSVEANTTWWLERTSQMRLLIRAVEQEADEHPATALILKDVDDELFQSGFQDDPFRLSGISRVYLAPGSEAAIRSREDLGGISRFRISPDDALRLISTGQARVLDVTGSAPRDITGGFGRALGAGFIQTHPGLVQAGDPVYAGWLGKGWYQAENGFRWSGKIASLTLPGSIGNSARLHVTGYGAAPALAGGPVTLEFSAGGQDLGSCMVSRPAEQFECDFSLAKQAGSPSLEVTVKTSRTFTPPGDTRELGMVFLTFQVK